MKYKKLWLKYLSEVRRLKYAIVPTLTHFSEVINADYEEVSRELNAAFVYSTQHDIFLEGAMVGKYKGDIFRVTGQKVRDDGKLADLIEGLQEDDGFLKALNDTAAADWGEDSQEQEPQETVKKMR